MRSRDDARTKSEVILWGRGGSGDRVTKFNIDTKEASDGQGTNSGY